MLIDDSIGSISKNMRIVAMQYRVPHKKNEWCSTNGIMWKKNLWDVNKITLESNLISYIIDRFNKLS